MGQVTFNEAKERAEQRGDEWIFGAIQTDLALVPVQDRALFTPLGVLQFNNVMDSNGCASRSPLNILETKLNWFYDHGMHPAIQTWCDEQGYRVGGKFELSDAFIEILSGTTPTGNSLKAPVDTIRTNGVIPAHYLPLKDNMTWEEYMDPRRIVQAHRNIGKEFMKRITVNYEKVYAADFLTALKEDLLSTGVSAWPAPIGNVYPRTDAPFNHAVASVNPFIDILDNYIPFNKRLATDYKFFDWGYSLSITAQNPYPQEVETVYNTLAQYGLLSFFADWYKRFTLWAS